MYCAERVDFLPFGSRHPIVNLTERLPLNQLVLFLLLNGCLGRTALRQPSIAPLLLLVVVVATGWRPLVGTLPTAGSWSRVPESLPRGSSSTSTLGSSQARPRRLRNHPPSSWWCSTRRSRSITNTPHRTPPRRTLDHDLVRAHVGLMRHAWWPFCGLDDLFLGRWSFGSVQPSGASLEHTQGFMRQLGAPHADVEDRHCWRTWRKHVDGEIASPLCYRDPVEIDHDASVCLVPLMRHSCARKTELCSHDTLCNEESPQQP